MIVLTVLFFLGAALGHLVWMIGCHNWCYGLNLPHHAGKLIHLAFAGLILTLPLWYFAVFGFDLSLLFRWPPEEWWQPLVAGYVVSCWIAGFLWLPWITAYRGLRPLPREVTATSSRIVDIVKELGHRPQGRGKRQFLSRLPSNQIFQVEMVERTLSLPRLPAAWDGLTILHVSDLHLCGTPDKDYYRHILERCAAWEPDIMALTGDYVDSLYHHSWIMPALGWLKWKIGGFAILGNHDSWYDPAGIRQRLAKLGLNVLANNWQQIEVRGEPLIVIGNEDPWLTPLPDLSNCPVGPFRLCLSHSPDTIHWARRAGVDLMLAGHVHGGQIRFPVIGSLLVPSKLGRRYDCGTFSVAPTVLHVSRGLAGDIPLRYGCMPEVTLLTLRRQG